MDNCKRSLSVAGYPFFYPGFYNLPPTTGETMGEIKLDAHNYRKHDERNLKLIKKSLKNLGAGRSILIDANGVIIAGNATYQTAQELGIPVETIKIDGSKVIALQRTDLHTQDKERKAMALMDNTTSANPNYDYGEIQTDFSAEELPELGIEDLPEVTDAELKEVDIKHGFEVAVECISEQEQQELFNKLVAEGYKCRLLTL